MIADALTLDRTAGSNSPDVVFEELMEQITWAVKHQPRDLQERIGPSEIGEPCDRALIAKLMNLPEPEEPPNWRAWVGTQMHAGMERIFADAPGQDAPAGPRYLLETQVSVGHIGGVEITGHCDLFDTLTGTSVDWKSKSMTRMLDHKRHGAGPVYRAQGHLYGLGWVRKGYHVNNVMNIYLRRDGELHDTFFWAEPFDEAIAIAALRRANELHALATLLGAQAAMDLYPHCTYEFCRTCRNFRPPFNAPRQLETTVAEWMAAAK
jgi:hypothetical protein